MRAMGLDNQMGNKATIADGKEGLLCVGGDGWKGIFSLEEVRECLLLSGTGLFCRVGWHSELEGRMSTSPSLLNSSSFIPSFPLLSATQLSEPLMVFEGPIYFFLSLSSAVSTTNPLGFRMIIRQQQS